MVLWWLGNALLILVVAPVVVKLANNLLRPATEVRAYANDILEHGVNVTGELDALPMLEQTRRLSDVALDALLRYKSALRRLL